MLLMSQGVTSQQGYAPTTLCVDDPKQIAEQVSEPEAASSYQDASLRTQQSIVFATWAAVVVSSFALIGLGLTVHFARQAWKATDASAKADNEALKLTRIQLEEARKIGSAQVTAYLSISNFGIVLPESYFEPLLVQIVVSNSGQTPAIDLEGDATIDFHFDDLETKQSKTARLTAGTNAPHRSIILPDVIAQTRDQVINFPFDAHTFLRDARTAYIEQTKPGVHKVIKSVAVEVKVRAKSVVNSQIDLHVSGTLLQNWLTIKPGFHRIQEIDNWSIDVLNNYP
ncbi:MAG: hypothetical protein AAGL09_18120 [Pseudomonadota bacterium]